MVLISINSTENDNGYDFTNDFAEALVIEPNSTLSLVSVMFERNDAVSNFVVDATNDRFTIKQGSSTSVAEVVILTRASYKGSSLANEIQLKLNVLGTPKGFAYMANYNQDDGKFELTSAVHIGALTPIAPSGFKSIIPYNGAVMNDEIQLGNANPFNLNCQPITDQRSNVVFTNEFIETITIPTLANGGSYIRMTIDAEIANPTTGVNRAVMLGFWSNQMDRQDPFHDGSVRELANSSVKWLDVGLMIVRDNNNGRKGIKIIENGVDIGCVETDGGTRLFNAQAGDSFEVAVFSNNVVPKYRYKKAGTNDWIDFRVGGGGINGFQTFAINSIKGINLYGVAGADNKTNISNLLITDKSGTLTDFNYVEFEPLNTLPGFGKLTGFLHTSYTMKGVDGSAGNTIQSDHTPVPGKDLNPVIHLNVNNLPLRSLVGSKFKKDAIVNDAPLGSQNGISRLLAQVPRYHENNGNSNIDRYGPFYYDYFPYSVRLKNAHSINLNELHISLTNLNGTLADDISSCNLLLNISNEENIGGYGKESISRPREMKQSQEQRDVLKSQMEYEVS